MIRCCSAKGKKDELIQGIVEKGFELEKLEVEELKVWPGLLSVMTSCLCDCRQWFRRRVKRSQKMTRRPSSKF